MSTTSDAADRCWCAELPTDLPGVWLTSEVRLASVLDEVGENPEATEYRCLVCGQRWDDRAPDRPGLHKV